MPEHLILRLETPLMAFGDTMIDATGPTHDLPIVSAITGLIANALGWRRGKRECHQRLQDRIVVGARLDRPGTELRDYQTARLFEDEVGWTTRGQPEGRKKSPSYKWGGSGRKELTHQRFRFYRSDALVTIALRLEPASEAPDLDAVASALDMPARPLFIGRKPCLPSTPILAGRADAASTYDALRRWPLEATSSGTTSIKLIVPRGEAATDDLRQSVRIADRRNWISGVHTGESDMSIVSIDVAQFAPAGAKPEVAT